MKKQNDKNEYKFDIFSSGEYDYSQEISISTFNFNNEYIEENNYNNIDSYLKHKNKKGFFWLNIDNIYNKKLIEIICEKHNVHPLVIKDIAGEDENQRPKFEEFEDYSYIVFKMLYYKNENIISEKISMLLFDKKLITFQEVPGDVFDVIRTNLRSKKSKIRKFGVDFLAYTLINAVVDNYLIIMEKIGEQIDCIEDIIMDTTEREVLKNIHTIRNNIIFLRKSIWPLREVLYQIEHGRSDFILEENTIYFKDVNHHINQIIDQIELNRESLAGMVDIFLSNVDHKLNNVMKRLTTITTIFMPLTVITGIGGMSEWSAITGIDNWMITYPIFILSMGIIGAATYMLLKFIKWL